MYNRVKMYKRVAVVIVVAALVISFVYYMDKQNNMDESKVSIIDASELKSMMKNKDFILINVHIPYAGDIEGTDMSIPYNEIEKINLPKDEKIVVYCRSGSMSRIASEELVRKGYTKVYELKGGMSAWKKNGGKIVYRE